MARRGKNEIRSKGKNEKGERKKEEYYIKKRYLFGLYPPQTYLSGKKIISKKGDGEK